MNGAVQGPQQFLFGFYNPCRLPSNPGWPLRNLLALICSRWKLEKVYFFCYRENRGFADLSLSLIDEALISVSQGWKDHQHMPNAVGWEFNRGKKVPNAYALRNPWILLGAGTLGCQVARMLMAWGVRKITLVDSGKEAEGVVMAIPIPGHPVPTQQEDSVLEDRRRLQDLIDSHDVVFLLTDTRESRWLPTLLSANFNKITITAALGFNSFLVMRHGAGPIGIGNDVKADGVNNLSVEMGNFSLMDGDRMHILGCYFCNDVAAPIDSTSNRTLDQQ